MQFEVHSETGLFYDADNLRETVRWIRSRNVIMQRKSEIDATATLWGRVTELLRPIAPERFDELVLGKLAESYLAHWMVDSAREFPSNLNSDAYRITFFVRPGPKPVMRHLIGQSKDLKQ